MEVLLMQFSDVFFNVHRWCFFNDAFHPWFNFLKVGCLPFSVCFFYVQTFEVPLSHHLPIIFPSFSHHFPIIFPDFQGLRMRWSWRAAGSGRRWWSAMAKPRCCWVEDVMGTPMDGWKLMDNAMKTHGKCHENSWNIPWKWMIQWKILSWSSGWWNGKSCESGKENPG